MNFKQVLWALVLLVVVGGLFAWGASYTAPPATQNTAGHPLSGTLGSDGNYTYKEDADYYTVDATYPANVPLSAAASVKAESTIEKALSDDIAQFKADGNFANLTAEDVRIQGLGPDRKYAYGAEYKKYQSADTASYVFSIYEDTLGAHPNGHYKTFVFDQQGNLLTLSAVLSKNPNWLEELSLLVSNDVSKQMRALTGLDDLTGSIYPEGLAAKEENFQNFAIDGTDLLIEIPPYQVAAYAAGSFEVRIPLASIDK